MILPKERASQQLENTQAEQISLFGENQSSRWCSAGTGRLSTPHTTRFAGVWTAGRLVFLAGGARFGVTVLQITATNAPNTGL